MAKNSGVEQNAFLIIAVVAATTAIVGLSIVYLLSEENPILQVIAWSSIFSTLLNYLGAGVGIIISYLFAEASVEITKSRHSGLWAIKRYVICVVFCGVLGFSVASRLGTHKEDDDPLYGGGETIVDFAPSDKERVSKGLEVFLCTLIPALFGIHAGIEEVRRKKQFAEGNTDDT